MRDDRNIQPRRAAMGIAAPRRYTVAPHTHTPVTIRTLPHAVCSVHAEADADPKHSLKVYADDEGVVCFHIQPSSATHDIARLEVDCTTSDKLVRYPLHLRISLVPSVEMPSPPVEKPLARRHDGAVRPALSLDEAMRLTDEEALARGLPMRPNPDEQAGTEQDATNINLGFIQVTLTNYYAWDRVPAAAADRAGDQQLHHQSGR
jgi:hypothetical protein